EKGIPVVYYISPQVWASRPGRIAKLARTVDKMLVIYPFEELLYRKAGIPVAYVGHPLMAQLPAPATESPSPSIGLLPGSRRDVAIRHMPNLIKTAELLRQEFPNARYVLFRPEEIEDHFYRRWLEKYPWIEVQCDPSFQVRRGMWLSLGVSGTS